MKLVDLLRAMEEKLPEKFPGASIVRSDEKVGRSPDTQANPTLRVELKVALEEGKTWQRIRELILKQKPQNVILLGGENFSGRKQTLARVESGRDITHVCIWETMGENPPYFTVCLIDMSSMEKKPT